MGMQHERLASADAGQTLHADVHQYDYTAKWDFDHDASLIRELSVISNVVIDTFDKAGDKAFAPGDMDYCWCRRSRLKRPIRPTCLRRQWQFHHSCGLSNFNTRVATLREGCIFQMGAAYLAWNNSVALPPSQHSQYNRHASMLSNPQPGRPMFDDFLNPRYLR